MTEDKCATCGKDKQHFKANPLTKRGRRITTEIIDFTFCGCTMTIKMPEEDPMHFDLKRERVRRTRGGIWARSMKIAEVVEWRS